MRNTLSGFRLVVGKFPPISSSMGRGRKEDGASQSQSSQKRSRASLSQEDGDDEEEYSMSQAKSRKSSDFCRETDVQAVVRLILARDAEKKPLSHTDLLQVFKDNAKAARPGNLKAVLESAQGMLKDLFGFDLVKEDKAEITEEIENTGCSLSQASMKYYWLQNILPVPSAEKQAGNADGAAVDVDGDDATEEPPFAKRNDTIDLVKNRVVLWGLTMVLCQQIMLNSNRRLPEANVLEILAHFGLRKDIMNSRFGGDAIKVLKQLCDQMYLERTTEKNDEDETVISYLVGLRGRKEIGKEKIVACVERWNDGITETARCTFRLNMQALHKL